ncbi:MAG: hypothetical protein J6034_06850 [Bacteroidaceae bacterium]|nr:hypothetical protein [Bacteroidaceae bacterium]
MKEKYCVVYTNAEGGTEIQKFFYLKRAREFANGMLSILGNVEINLCTWTKTRGVGQIIKRY